MTNINQLVRYMGPEKGESWGQPEDDCNGPSKDQQGLQQDGKQQ